MGNGVSHSGSATKDNDNLVDEGHVGQFHKVLVEPEYCLPGPPTVSDDPHNSATLRIGEKVEVIKTDTNKEEVKEANVDDKKTSRTSFYQANADYAVIEDDNSALLIDTTDSNKEASCETSKSSEKLNTNIPETTNDDNKNEDKNQTSSNCVDESLKSGTDSVIVPVESTDLSETIPLTTKDKRPEKKSKKESVRKESKSLLNMFKFSKHKPKVVAEFVVNVNDEQQQKDAAKTDIKKSDVNSDLIDSLKETSVDGEESISLIEDKGKDLLIQKAKKHASKDKSNNADQNKNSPLVDDEKQQFNVERLNSLDSGIVVDKIVEHCMNGQNVEVDIKDKTNAVHNSNESSTDNDKDSALGFINGISTDTNKSLEDNGSRHVVSGDNNVMITNGTGERPIDVVGLEPTVASHNLLAIDSSGENDDKIKPLESDQPGAKADLELNTNASEENMGEKEKKMKKKSWSFQFGGNKKNINKSEKIDSSTTSLDQTDSSQKKKSKSIFGKFSFRKSTDDLSKIPNVDDFNESENIDSKKKNKLKKIKAKKDKKASLKKKITDNEELDAFNTDGLSEDTNTPRSRRSIVEEEATVSQSDAFDGVSLSDLSLDGDQVSHNPNGAEPGSRHLDKDIKALAKTAENLSSLLIKDPQTESKSNKPKTEDKVNAISDDKRDIVEDGKISENQTNKTVGGDANGIEKKDEPLSEIGTEYAHVVKDKSKLVNCMQEIEYANLHALPLTDPILDETKNDLTNIMVDQLKVNETGDKKIENDLERVPAGDGPNKQEKNQTKVNVENNNSTIVSNLVTGSTIVEPVTEYENMVEPVTEYENMVKEKTNLPLEKCEINSSNVKIEHVTQLKSGDISPGATENQDDSDAYVHLVQLVKDYRDDKFDKHLNNSDNKTVSGTNSVSINLVPVIKQDVCSNLNASPTEISKGQIKRAIIMKEVGVQAPDIHIPMDIEKDFGCGSKPGEFVEIGVQVSDKDFDETGYSVKDGNDVLKSPSINIASVYF